MSFFGYAIRSPGIFSDLLRSFQVFKFSDLAKHASEDWRSLVTDFVCSEEFCPDPFYVSNMPTKAKKQKFAWCSSSGKDAAAKHMRESRRKKLVLFSHSECICAVCDVLIFFCLSLFGVFWPRVVLNIWKPNFKSNRHSGKVWILRQLVKFRMHLCCLVMFWFF